MIDEPEPLAMIPLSVSEISVLAQLVMRAPSNIEGLTEDVARRILEKLRHAEPTMQEFPPMEQNPSRRYVGTVPGPMKWRIFIVKDDDTETPLPLSLDVFNHSPTGFSWGYLGSGPAQSALAILVDAIGALRALTLHQAFKRQVIAKLDPDAGWTMKLSDVLAWVQLQEVL